MGAHRPDEQRVVVTGMGIVARLGEDVNTFWKNLVAGRSGIVRVDDLPACVECRVVGEMGGFDLDAYLSSAPFGSALKARAAKLLRVTPLPGRIGSMAAAQAVHDAGLLDMDGDRARIGHALAAQNTNTKYLFENLATFEKDPEFIEPLFGMLSLDTDVLTVTNELLQLLGPNAMVGGACASGNLAVLTGLDWIRAGRADAVVVTGAGLETVPLMLQGWVHIGAVTCSFNDAPERASRPFDVGRDGFAPAGGGATVVRKRLDHARARGATIYGEVLGAASTSDGSRLTKPHRGGQERAMKLALDDARVARSDVSYVNAHATSTPLGDVVEVEAIKAVLGEHARSIPINATKSMVGHTLTAAGVIELIATLLQARHRTLHPTVNLDEVDREAGLDLDFVPNVAREHPIGIALSNSFGFGGINCSIVVGPPP